MCERDVDKFCDRKEKKWCCDGGCDGGEKPVPKPEPPKPEPPAGGIRPKSPWDTVPGMMAWCKRQCTPAMCHGC